MHERHRQNNSNQTKWSRKKKNNPWHSYDLDFLFFFKMQNNKASGMSCRQKPFSIRHFANRSQNKSQIIWAIVYEHNVITMANPIEKH
jgi:hypothetical protein